MSTDNWSKCPKCKSQKEIVREDYEIYLTSDDGVLHIYYDSRCANCDYTFSFKKEVKTI